MAEGGGRRIGVRMAMGLLVTAAVTAIAIFALGRVLREMDLEQVVSGFNRIEGWRVALAITLAAACYAALSGYDGIALKSIGRRLPWGRTLMGSTAAYALSHNLGFAPITGSFARHRVYMRDGIGLADVARIVILTGASFWLGVILVMGICLVAVPDIVSSKDWALPHPLQAAAGLLVIDVVVLYLILISRGWRKIGWGRWTVPLPSFRDALLQSGISLIEMALASAVLWVLIPGSTPADYPLVLVAYVSAFVMVLITHTPGGAGVLETIVLLMLSHLAPADVLTALILFRIIFHLMPLGVAIAILAVHRRHPA